MKIELSKPNRAEAVASLKRYAEENFAEPLGDLAAGLLLDFFIEDIGPAIYNKGVADAQTRIQLRVADVDAELYLQPFGTGSKSHHAKNSKAKKTRCVLVLAVALTNH